MIGLLQIIYESSHQDVCSIAYSSDVWCQALSQNFVYDQQIKVLFWWTTKIEIFCKDIVYLLLLHL